MRAVAIKIDQGFVESKLTTFIYRVFSLMKENSKENTKLMSG